MRRHNRAPTYVTLLAAALGLLAVYLVAYDAGSLGGAERVKLWKPSPRTSPSGIRPFG